MDRRLHAPAAGGRFSRSSGEDPALNISSPAADCFQTAQHLACSQSRRQSCGRRPRTAPPAARRQRKRRPRMEQASSAQYENLRRQP